MRLARDILNVFLMAVSRYVENPANPPESDWTDGTD